jgi:hypothetical protein
LSMLCSQNKICFPFSKAIVTRSVAYQRVQGNWESWESSHLGFGHLRRHESIDADYEIVGVGYGG